MGCDAPPDPLLPASPSHQVHFIDVDRLFVPIEREDDAEPHRRFGRGDSDDEDREHLTDGVVQLAENAIRLMLTAFRISSIDMKMMMMLRRTITPITPIMNSAADNSM